MAARAVFLDRDDTIIRDPGYISEPSAVSLLPGAALAIKSLSQAGFKVIVVTNQSGVARGILTEEALEKIHKELNRQLSQAGAKIDGIYYCPFHPDGIIPQYSMESELRKPSPGMLLKAARDMNLDLASSWMVGDSDRDVEAGRRAGCRTILIVRPPKGNESPSDGNDSKAEFKVRNLVDAARIVMRESESKPAPAASAQQNKTPLPADVVPAEEKPKMPVEALAEVVKHHKAAKVELPSSAGKSAEAKSAKPVEIKPLAAGEATPPAKPAVPPVATSSPAKAEEKAKAKPADKPKEPPATPTPTVAQAAKSETAPQASAAAPTKNLSPTSPPTPPSQPTLPQAETKATGAEKTGEHGKTPEEKSPAQPVKETSSKPADAAKPAAPAPTTPSPKSDESKKSLSKPQPQMDSATGEVDVKNLIKAAKNVLSAKSSAPEKFDVVPPTTDESSKSPDKPAEEQISPTAEKSAYAQKVSPKSPTDKPAEESFSIVRLAGGMVQMLVVLPLLVTARHLFRADYPAATAWGIVAMVLQTMALTIYTMLSRSK